jgi:hypothetical protein
MFFGHQHFVSPFWLIKLALIRHGRRPAADIRRSKDGDFQIIIVDGLSVYASIADGVLHRASVNAVVSAKLDGGWIAFADLKFGIGGPCLKHLSREMIAAFFVIYGKKFSDFIKAALV